MNLEILYEDEYVVVINKPSGLMSVPFEGFKGRTALSTLEQIMRKKGTWSKFHHPFAVHRLDRDTSGVMVFALNEKIQKSLMENWNENVIQRRYIAVAENPSQSKNSLSENGTIDAPLSFNSKNHSSYVSNKQNSNKIHSEKTVSAVTHYTILKRGKRYTLFQLELETGRKNQIRAHLSSIGYPLAGDSNYRAKTDPFGRLALHARSLEFFHPVTKEIMKFEVPEDSFWQKYVEKN